MSDAGYFAPANQTPLSMDGVVQTVTPTPDDLRVALLKELSMHLWWASRFNPNSPSRKRLRAMFATAPVLDIIEELVNAALSLSPAPEQEKPNG